MPNMESNAGALVCRLALKTRFSEMGWGSTPLLSANFRLRSANTKLVGSTPTFSAWEEAPMVGKQVTCYFGRYSNVVIASAWKADGW